MMLGVSKAEEMRMRILTITGAAIALAVAGAAIWWWQTGLAKQGGYARKRPGNDISRNPMPRWAVEQFNREAKPSDDALRRAQALLEAGDVAGAEAECRQAVELSP